MISSTKRLDGVAVALSGACMIHCLLLPIAAAFLPIFVAAAEAEWVHWLFVALAVPTSLFALMHNHLGGIRMLLLRAAATFGLILLTCGALGWPSHELERTLTVLGGLILAGAHGVNFFSRKAHM